MENINNFLYPLHKQSTVKDAYSNATPLKQNLSREIDTIRNCVAMLVDRAVLTIQKDIGKIYIEQYEDGSTAVKAYGEFTFDQAVELYTLIKFVTKNMDSEPSILELVPIEDTQFYAVRLKL